MKAGVLLVLISCLGILFLIVQSNIEHNDNITNVISDESQPQDNDAEEDTFENVTSENKTHTSKTRDLKFNRNEVKKNKLVSQLQILKSKHDKRYKEVTKKFKLTLFNSFVREVIF